MDLMKSSWFSVCLVSVAATRALAQQVSVPGLIASARSLVAANQMDSAVVLLNRASDSTNGGTLGERTNALVLLGIVRFYLGQDSLTANAFRAALVLDTTLQVPGLVRIDSSLPPMFERVRADVLSAARAAARLPHYCVGGCKQGEVSPRLQNIPQLVLDAGPDFLNTHAFVLVRLVVDETGVPDEATVRVESSSMPAMNSQVLDAVRAAHFRPALAHGVPVKALVELRFDFRAEGQTAITVHITGP